MLQTIAHFTSDRKFSGVIGLGHLSYTFVLTAGHLTAYYHISSPISLVIFSVFDTEICKIFHQKWGSAYSRGFGIKKIAEFGGFTFFLDNTSEFEGI